MPDEKSFEALHGEMAEAVRQLEAGDLSLEESLVLFARATALAEQCNALLDRAELRVRQLVERPDGSSVTEPFESWQNG
jgi:exodeoxyribonuclease VII small subunit